MAILRFATYAEAASVPGSVVRWEPTISTPWTALTGGDIPQTVNPVEVVVTHPRVHGVNVADQFGYGMNSIHDAIAFAIANDIDSVYLPAGNYTIDKPIVVRTTEGSGLAIIGDGDRLTVITKTGNTTGTGSNLTHGGTGSDSYAKDAGIIIEHDDNTHSYNVSLKGFRLVAGSSNAYGIYASRVACCNFDGITVDGFSNGFVTHDCWQTTLRGVVCDGRGRAGSYGFVWEFDGISGVTGTTVDIARCWARNVANGWRMRNVGYCMIANCGADDIHGGTPWFFETCYVQLLGCGAEDITLGTNCAIMQISGGRVGIQGFRSNINLSASDQCSALRIGSGAYVTLSHVFIDNWSVNTGAVYAQIIDGGAVVVRNGPCLLPTNGNNWVGYGGGAYQVDMTSQTPYIANASGLKYFQLA